MEASIAEDRYHRFRSTHLYVLYTGLPFVITEIIDGELYMWQSGTGPYGAMGFSSPIVGAVLQPFTPDGNWRIDGIAFEKKIL